MKFVIMAVAEGEDFATCEIEIPAPLADLKPIMGWTNINDSFYDYKLTPEQTFALERAFSLTLPKNMALYLTCIA